MLGPLLEVKPGKSARRCGAKHDLPSQNVQNTRGSDHFWRLRCTKKCTPLWREATIFKSKVLKTDGLGPLLEVQMSKKCRKSARRCGAKHIWKSKDVKKSEGFAAFFDVLMSKK